MSCLGLRVAFLILPSFHRAAFKCLKGQESRPSYPGPWMVYSLSHVYSPAPRVLLAAFPRGTHCFSYWDLSYVKQRLVLQTAPSQVRIFQTRLLCSLHFSRENWEQGCSLLQTKTRWAAEQVGQVPPPSRNITRSQTWMLWLFSWMGVQLVEVGFLTRVPLI